MNHYITGQGILELIFHFKVTCYIHETLSALPSNGGHCHVTDTCPFR